MSESEGSDIGKQLGSFVGSEAGLQPTASKIHSQMKRDAHLKNSGENPARCPISGRPE